MPSRVRVLASLTAVALAALALTACSGSDSTSAAKGCKATADGSVAQAVKVSGSVGKEPTVAFDSPLKATSTQRHVVTVGDGPVAKAGSRPIIELSLYNGATGKVATTTGFGAKGVPIQPTLSSSTLTGLVKTVQCATAGSRIVGVVPPKDGYSTQGNSQFGIGAKDDLVFVIDVLKEPAKADGEDQPAPAGFPTVKLAKSGRPTITIAKGTTAPTETMVGELKQGDGDTVASGDSVAVQYQGVNLRTGKVFDQSWGKDPLLVTTDGVIAGFTKALVGQKVGSQVIAMIPPADGYGSAGQADAGIKGTDTLVFVLDILNTYHPSAQQ